MPTQAGWDRYGTNRTYEAGEFIFKEGEPAEHVYAVSSGRVAITKNTSTDTQLVLSYVGPGEMLGEIAMWANEQRTASAMAAEPLELLVISRDDFWHLFDEDRAFRHLITNEMVRHILAADQSRLAAAATERTLSTLIELRQATTRFIIHDLQNPLGLIRLALSLVESDPAYDPNSEMAEHIASAQRSLARMLTLVDSLLDTDRLSEGTYTLDLTLIDTADVIEEVVSRNQTAAQQKHITLTAEQPSSSLPSIKADRLRIDRVLTNLIDNALKFTPVHGRVWVDVQAEDNDLVIGVNDTGPGIPPEQRDKVFERFVQTESGRKSRRGFGLGLAYCLLAVQLHGGNIWVEDGPDGTGTRFVFTLPRKTVAT